MANSSPNHDPSALEPSSKPVESSIPDQWVGRDLLTPQLYKALRNIAGAHMRNQPPGHTLQPTALVHEAFLRLAPSTVEWRGRTHFFAAAAQAIRHVLVDHARKRKARHADRRVVLKDPDGLLGQDPSSDSLIEIDELLNKLAELHPRQARVVELRFFAGMSGAEIAQELGVNRDTVVNDWAVARAWLRGMLSKGLSNDTRSI